MFERPAKDGRAGAQHHGWLLASDKPWRARTLEANDSGVCELPVPVATRARSKRPARNGRAGPVPRTAARRRHRVRPTPSPVVQRAGAVMRADYARGLPGFGFLGLGLGLGFGFGLGFGLGFGFLGFLGFLGFFGLGGLG